jgi:hypothetical protein
MQQSAGVVLLDQPLRRQPGQQVAVPGADVLGDRGDGGEVGEAAGGPVRVGHHPPSVRGQPGGSWRFRSIRSLGSRPAKACPSVGQDERAVVRLCHPAHPYDPNLCSSAGVVVMGRLVRVSLPALTAANQTSRCTGTAWRST